MPTGGTVEMQRGDTAQFDVTCTRPNASGVQTAVDLTGMLAAIFTAKRTLSDLDAAAVFQKTYAAGAIAFVGAATAGILRVTLAAADTSGLEDYAVTLFVDIKVTESDGIKSTPWSGSLIVHPNVTRT